MSPYCIECGSEIEESWNSCPNCGKVLKAGKAPQSQPVVQAQPQPQPQPYQVQPYQKSYSTGGQNTYGVVALVCGIIGLFFGGVIFGIVAIVMGGLGLNRDEDTRAAKIGLVLGVIDFVFFILSSWWVFSWFAWPFPF